MITDDPGTPGAGKWENNIAIAFEHRGGETSYDVPAIDLNYGAGEHIQLTLQTAPVLLKTMFVTALVVLVRIISRK